VTAVDAQVAAVDILRVLVVDDDEVDRLSVRRALAATNTRPELSEAADAEGAFEAIRRGGLDCVLLDFQLPQMDGLTLLCRLRSQGYDVPVVILTGHRDEATAVELMKAGAADYLSKGSLSPVRLEQSILRAVRVHRAERAVAAAHRELQSSEERYRFLAESIPQIVWTAFADGTLDYCNQRLYAYIGLPLAEVQPLGWAGAIHPDDREPSKARWQRSLRSGEDYESQYRLRRASDQSYRWHLSRAIALRDAGGAVLKWFGTCTDIDDQRRITAELEEQRARVEEANRAKDVFLTTVSHELRTPLNAILGWVRMLLANAVSEDKRERALRTIERNGRVQAELIEDLLDVSRIASGKLRLEVGPVDIVDIAEAALETVRPAAEAKGLALKSAIETTTGAMIGDAGRLQQIICNLLTNAVKFTTAPGWVKLTLKRDDDSVTIVVTDNGRGIDPAFLPHVFDRFRQGDGAITRTNRGLGLGLAIVRHLVELHGGTVEARSEGDGKGAEFEVRLPTAATRSQRDSTPSEPLPPASEGRQGRRELADLRILVVDDELDARELLVSILEECKVRVSQASNVAEAIRVFEREPPDMVISDVGMPNETGYDLIRQIRARAPEHGGRTPAVALTAYARTVDRTQALRSGFNMHLAKPFEPSELIAILTMLSGRGS
jgi:PAS domain S-box-containing protein